MSSSFKTEKKYHPHRHNILFYSTSYNHLHLSHYRISSPGSRFKMPSTRSLFLTALVPLAHAVALPSLSMLKPREYVPVGLPLDAPLDELKVQPTLDWDRDGCYNVAAVGADGTFAEGMEPKGAGEGGCRDEVDIDNANVYSRRRCNSGWCVIIYDYYFEKDVALSTGTGGHRHDIEHIAVWTQDSNPKYVAVSEHGEYVIKSWEDKDLHKDGNHSMIVYHKSGPSTHAFRFAKADDVAKPENHKGVFWLNKLVGWNNFPSPALRDSLMNHDFGKANWAISEKNFADNIKRAKPSQIKVFDANRDD